VYASAAEALLPGLPWPSRTARDSSNRSDEANQHKPLCCRNGGFSLHAARVVEPDDRIGLERLCRYGLRAPYALDRFSLDPDGRVRYELPRPRFDGRTELVFEPVALLRRLAALIPAPYSNLVRYHGVFANRSRYRPLLPPPPPSDADLDPNHDAHPTSCAHAAATNATSPVEDDDDLVDMTEPRRRRRSSWAQLLRRVIGADPLKCPRCSATMVVIAFLTDPQVLRKILNHLGLPTHPPPLSPARLPQQHLLDLDSVDDLPLDDDDLEGLVQHHSASTDSRAPP
jgi:hypothetical protein